MKLVHAQKDAQSTIQQQSRRIPLCSVLCLLLATCSRAERKNATCLNDQCFEYGTCNPETDRCECPLGRHGLDCSIPLPDPEPQCKEHSHNLVTCTGFTKTLCLNSCNGQGWCAGGFCHCKPGFYGADCSLSTSPDGRPVLLAGQGYMPRQHGVKIYVYELPPVANTWTYIARIDRPLVQVLLQRMLSSGVRTTDGDSADYYFIPLLMRTRTHTVNHLAAVVHYVRKHWPWWDRTGGGHRHLLVAPGDIGRRILTPELLHMTENCTFLTHWGLHRNHSGGNWLASHRPGKDIVVPPLTPPDEPIVYSPLHATLKKNRKPRLGELFFAGRICGDNQKPTDGKCSEKRQDYSAGTRQQVAHHHWNRPNWTITTHTPAYAEALSTHIFCLSPTGGGYGRRSVQSLLMGCIPVTITDHVHQPFEPEVDWARFSVPVREDDIAQLHHVLTGLRASPHTLAQMQVRLRCAAQHMYYSSTFGEIMGEDGRFDAFETLMEVLRMRKERPELHPRDYEAQDKRFHDFIHCRSKPTGGRVQLCTQNRLVKSNNITHCRESYDAVPMRWMRMFYSWPGGAVCGRNRDVGRCPRSWL